MSSLAVSFFMIQGYASEKFSKPPAGYFYIKSVQTESEKTGYWDQPGIPDNFDNGVPLSLNVKENTPDQQYKFMNAGDGYFYIQSKNGGLADVSGNRKENGTSVMMWKGHGGSNQLFRLKYLGKGRWKIYAKNGTTVSVSRDAGTGSNIQIWEDQEGSWMEWYFEDAVSGKIYMPDVKQK